MPIKKRVYTERDLDQIAADAEYRNCVFDGLPLKHRSLENCTFSGCSFQNADLTDARLNASTLRG